MMHSPSVGVIRRIRSRQVSLSRWIPVVLSALALMAGGPAASASAGATTTVVSVTPESPASGDVISIKAQVTFNSGIAPVTGGIVTFSDTYNGITEVLGTAQVQSVRGIPGVAILQTEAGGVGTHQLFATYAGTSAYATSTSIPQAVTFVGPYRSATALTAGTTSPYTLTGTVSAFGPSIPTGSVTFTDTTSNVTLGSAPLSTTAATQFTPYQINPLATLEKANTGNTVGPAIGDFNGDGRPDYAVPSNAGSVYILLGNGDGTFTNGTTITTAATFEPTSAVVGDFNGDGLQDLAVLSAAGTGSVNIYLGNGDGTFQVPVSYPVAASTSGSRLLAIGDFNRDGFQDLVATNNGLNQVAVLLGKGDGTFGPAAYFGVGASPWNVVVGDINQDGILDLAVASNGSPNVSILQGVGDGTFLTFTTAATGGQQVSSVAIGDFNGDGFPDLATTSVPENSVYVLLNTGAAIPGFKTAVAYPMNSSPRDLTVADFNRDGFPDIVSANNGNATVGILLNSAATGANAGTFNAASFYPVGGNAVFVNVGDLNGDDRVDLTAVVGTGLSVLLSGQAETASLPNINVYGCGAQSVTATYGGDGNYGSSTSAASSLTPAAAQATTLTLAAIPASGAIGSQIMLQATLSPSQFGSTTTNGETITFFNFGFNIGTATLSNGVAVLNYTLPNIPFIPYFFTATYGGDCAFQKSNSNNNPVTGLPLQSSTITWPNPASIPYGTALSAMQLNATDPVAGSFAYSPGLGTVLPAGTTNLSVVFTPSVAGFGQETATVPITVTQDSTVITWPTPTPITYGTPLSDFQLDATASSGVTAVPFKGYYNVFGIYRPGSTYSQANSFDYDGYSYSTTTLGSTVVWNGMTFNIGPPNALDAVSNQTIPLPTGNYASLYVLGAMVNNIAASQTFIVTYVGGSTTTFTQNMSDWFNAKGWPGESVVSCSEQRNFENGTTQADSACLYGYQIPLDPTKTVQSVQLPSNANINILAMDLATPQIPGTFVYNPPAGTIEPVGTNTLAVTFTPNDTVDFKSVSATVKLVVTAPVTPIVTTTISWPTPAPITYGTPLSTLQLDAVAIGTARPTPVVPTSQLQVLSTSIDGTLYNLAGFDGAGNTYSYNQLGNGTVTYAGSAFTLGPNNVPNALTNGAVYTLTTPGNYSTVYLIGAANTTGQINQPFTLTYQDANGPVTETVSMSSWNAPAGYAGESVVASTTHANTQAGKQTAGTYDLYGYNIPADPTRTLVSVTLPSTPNDVIMALGFGTNTEVTVPGTYTYNPPLGTTTEPVGTDTLTVTFKPTDPKGYTAATGSTLLVVTQATPILNWPTPNPINVGQKLTKVQLDATATTPEGAALPGKFVYTPAAGSSFSAPGIYTLSVVFTPTDSIDYTTATATVQIIVGGGGTATGISGALEFNDCCFFSQPTPYIISVTGGHTDALGRPIAPTGTVTVTFNGVVIGTGTLAAVFRDATSTATFLVNSASFYPGNNNVMLNYGGDGNYHSASAPTTIALRNPAIQVNPATVNQSVTTTIPYVFAQAGSISYNFNPQSAPSTDFTDAGTGTCVSGKAENAGFLCNLSVAFQPLTPGIRKGVVAVNFTPGNGSQAEPTLYLFLSGMSDAAQIVLSSATQSVLNAGLNQPQSVVFNPTDTTSSNLYVANSNAGQIDTVPASGGGLTPWNSANTSLTYPSDISFDAFDNLVASDSEAAKVVSYAPTTLTQQTVGTGTFELGAPTQARFDFGGNLYIADAGNTPRIIQVPGEAYTPNQLNLGTTYNVSFPQALAVDNTGANLYVGDGNNNQILEIGLNFSGGAPTVANFPIAPCDSTVTSCSLNSPAGFAFDPNGDMFVTDSGARVLMVPSTHVASSTPTTLVPITGLINPTGITLDGSGNIYVSDVTGFVTKLLVNSGALVFSSTGSTLPTTVTNTGDLPLTITSLTFETGVSFTEKDNCTSSPIAPGASCKINVTANGGGSDILTLNSNAFSATGVTIQLTAPGGSPSVALPSAKRDTERRDERSAPAAHLARPEVQGRFSGESR
jgi:hypothetical protein